MPNTYALYYNPAALGGTKGTTVTGDLSVLLRFARYNRTADALSPSDATAAQEPNYAAANTGTANLTNVLALPFAGVNTDFGTENFRAGYAIYVPFGGLASWDKRDGIPGLPGTIDGVSRWHNISGQILAVYNTFGVAYRIPGANISIGASVSPIIHHVSTVRARNADGSDDTTSAGAIKEGRSYINATGVNLGVSAGIYWTPSDDFRLGVSYASQPGFGETRLSGTLETQTNVGTTQKQDVDFVQDWPDIVRLGVAWRPAPKWELRADGEFVRWSVLKRQCVVNPGQDCNVADNGADQSNGAVILNVPRDWNNAFGVRVGPGYSLNDQTELFGSLGLTTPAVPKETIDPSTIDSTRLYFTAGAKYDFSKHFSLAGSYNHIYFFTVNTEGKNNLNERDGVSKTPSADGRYKSQIGFVNVNASYTF